MGHSDREKGPGGAGVSPHLQGEDGPRVSAGAAAPQNGG